MGGKKKETSRPTASLRSNIDEGPNKKEEEPCRKRRLAGCHPLRFTAYPGALHFMVVVGIHVFTNVEAYKYSASHERRAQSEIFALAISTNVGETCVCVLRE